MRCVIAEFPRGFVLSTIRSETGDLAHTPRVVASTTGLTTIKETLNLVTPGMIMTT